MFSKLIPGTALTNSVLADTTMTLTTMGPADTMPQWDEKGARKRGEKYLIEHLAKAGMIVTPTQLTTRKVKGKKWTVYEYGRWCFTTINAGKPYVVHSDNTYLLFRPQPADWKINERGELGAAEKCLLCNRLLAPFYKWDGRPANHKITRCMDCNPWTAAELAEQAEEKRKRDLNNWLMDWVESSLQYDDYDYSLSHMDALTEMIDKAPEGVDVEPLRKVQRQLQKALKAYEALLD